MPVVLVNQAGRKRSYNLTGVKETLFEGKFTHEDKDGVKLQKLVRKNIPDSLHLSAGERSGWLPDDVLSCPEVASAIKRKELKAIQTVEENPPEEKPRPRTRRKK